MPGRQNVRPEKINAVQAIKEIADSSSSIILTNYSGMSVKQVTELRKELRQSGGKYKVVKNSLSVRALPDKDGFKEKITGPIAVLFIETDPVEPAKKLVNFIKANEKPEILGGVIEEEYLEKDDIIRLSKLPSREELIAKMVAGFNSPIYGLVNVLAGNLRNLVYALNAIKSKRETGHGLSTQEAGYSLPTPEGGEK